MINIFKKFENWLVEREIKKDDERRELLEKLGEWIGEELFNATDSGRVLREDYKNGEVTDITRYTIILHSREFTKKDLKFMLDGEKFRTPHHSLKERQINYIFNGIMTTFSKEKHLSDIDVYRINKMGIIKSEESIMDGYQFQFYIELCKRFKIKESIYNKCLKTFEDSRFMFDKFDWDSVRSGASLSIPVTIREFKISSIDECDIDGICNKLNRKLNQLINGDHKMEEREFIVRAEAEDYFCNVITITIRKA